MFKDLTEDEKVEAIAKGYNGFFAERETTQEAYNYMMQIISTLHPDEKASVITGLHVFINTVAVTTAKEAILWHCLIA